MFIKLTQSLDGFDMKIQFDHFTYKFDRWHGEIDFPMACSGTTKLQISMRGVSSEITTSQKQSIHNFISDYETLWCSIAQGIEQIEPDGGFEFQPTISLSSPGLVSDEARAEWFDYIVGYKAYRGNKYIQSFMACINNMQVSEVIVTN